MALYVNNASTVVEVPELWVNNAGTVVEVRQGWINNNGNIQRWFDNPSENVAVTTMFAQTVAGITGFIFGLMGTMDPPNVFGEFINSVADFPDGTFQVSFQATGLTQGFFTSILMVGQGRNNTLVSADAVLTEIDGVFFWTWTNTDLPFVPTTNYTITWTQPG